MNNKIYINHEGHELEFEIAFTFELNTREFCVITDNYEDFLVYEYNDKELIAINDEVILNHAIKLLNDKYGDEDDEEEE